MAYVRPGPRIDDRSVVVRRDHRARARRQHQRDFSQQFGTTDYPQLFAALTMSAIPVLAVFLLTQRQFIQGLVAGAVKA